MRGMHVEVGGAVVDRGVGRRAFEAHAIVQAVARDVRARGAADVPRVAGHVGADEREDRVGAVRALPRVDEVHRAFLDAQPADEQHDAAVERPAERLAQPRGLAVRRWVKAREIDAGRLVVHAWR